MGGGGREHALAWKLSQSPMLDTLFCAPGNPGISAEPRVTSVADLDIESNAEVSQPLSLPSSLMRTWTYILMPRCAQSACVPQGSMKLFRLCVLGTCMVCLRKACHGGQWVLWKLRMLIWWVQVVRWCKEREIGLVLVGPEAPLVAGLVDSLKQGGIRYLSPAGNPASCKPCHQYRHAGVWMPMPPLHQAP